jgi:putative holliday junction resolvase
LAIIPEKVANAILFLLHVLPPMIYDECMRLLGIDYGSKRIGIALSDESKTIATPKAVLVNGPKLIQEIKDICAKDNVIEIVLGDSKNFKGEPNKIMKKIEPFRRKLEEEIGLPVYMEQEFLTSFAAERFQGKNDMLDASAAALILQSYLDRMKNL